MGKPASTRPPQPVPAQTALAHVRVAFAASADALHELRAVTNALTHPDSKLRRLLREVEMSFAASERALDRAKGSQ